MEIKEIIQKLLDLQTHKWRKWEDTFYDEESGEVVAIPRKEVIDDSIHPEEKELLQLLYERIEEVETEDLRLLSEEIAWGDSIDQVPILYQLSERGDVLTAYRIGDVDRLQELCDNGNKDAAYFLGYMYNEGCEVCGVFIDKQKAREYYKMRLSDGDTLTDEEEDDEEEVGELQPSDYILKGEPEELAKVKILVEELAKEYGNPINKSDLWIPIGVFMNRIVGTDPDLRKYYGTLTSLTEVSETCIILHVESEDREPLFYALYYHFPDIDIE